MRLWRLLAADSPTQLCDPGLLATRKSRDSPCEHMCHGIFSLHLRQLQGSPALASRPSSGWKRDEQSKAFHSHSHCP
jgi:hypothetical protein